MPFYDSSYGLFRVQASYIDVHYDDHKTTDYPLDWSVEDCVMVKATSTNCLYYKGMKVMTDAVLKLGRKSEAGHWN